MNYQRNWANNPIYHCIKNKIPEINLPKETKDPYSENHKKLIKEIKGNKNRWKDIPRSSAGRISVIKMTVLPKAIYRVTAIPDKTPDIFHRIRTNNFKICMETQKTLDNQNSLEKEKQR